MGKKEFIENVELLSKFVDIDISYCLENELVISVNSNFECLEKITGINLIDLNRISSLDSKMGVFSTLLFEKYIFFKTNENNFLIIGPFLEEEIDEKLLKNNLVRLGLSLELAKKTFQYFKTLKILTLDAICSYLELIEKLFKEDDENKTVFASDVFKSEAFSDEYKENIYFHRLMFKVRSPISLEIKLSKSVEKGDVESSIEILNIINSWDNAVLSKEMLQSRKYSLVALCTILTRVLIKVNFSYVKAFAFSDTVINKIDSLIKIEDVNQFEKDMVASFCKLATENKNSKYSNSITQTIDYIYKNLSNKISIDVIAEFVHITPIHLCRTFKKEVGKTIVEFINMKKVEECAFLLKNTNESIVDIATSYQFCNESYFISVFKKYMGTTPKQYRKE